MGALGKLTADAAGVARVVGPGSAIRWISEVAAHFSEVRRRGDLQPADRAMGNGPFTVHFGQAVPLRVRGAQVFCGIREMYVRDVYLHGGLLKIEPDDVVVDLGANVGNFCNLALASGASHVVAVEPSSTLNDAMWKSLELNAGFSERVTLVRAFIGDRGEVQASLDNDPAYAGAKWLDEDALIAAANIQQADLLKCDIEGGEFGLLTRSSRLLKLARKLAIEIHAFAGDVDAFMHGIEGAGFRWLHVDRAPDGSVTASAART